MTETDWTKIPVDTPVLYRSHPDKEWQPGYFCSCNSIDPSIVRVWYEGKTSRTTGLSQSVWQCKLDPSAPSIINWIPNTGVRPDYKTVLVKYENLIRLGSPGDFFWDESSIKEYAIIE